MYQLPFFNVPYTQTEIAKLIPVTDFALVATACMPEYHKGSRRQTTVMGSQTYLRTCVGSSSSQHEIHIQQNPSKSETPATKNRLLHSCNLYTACTGSTKMSSSQTVNAASLNRCRPTHFGRRPVRAVQLGCCQRWRCALQAQKCQQRTKLRCAAVAAVVAERAKPVERIPTLPFVKIAGQEDMKLAILLNVIDPKIGGVLIMGERGTGKSVAVGCLSLSICLTATVCLW